MTTPAPAVTHELKALLRKVKLGRCLDTLARTPRPGQNPSFGPPRVPGTRPRRRGHPRDTPRPPSGRTAGLDADMRFENWDDTLAVNYDRPSSTSFARCVSSTPATTP